jgi:hypothetical protein
MGLLKKELSANRESGSTYARRRIAAALADDGLGNKELLALLERETRRLNIPAPTERQSLDRSSVSTWAAEPSPAPRDWIWPDRRYNVLYR